MKKYRALLKIEGEEAHTELQYQAINMTEAARIAEKSRLEIALKINSELVGISKEPSYQKVGYKTVGVVLITEE